MSNFSSLIAHGGSKCSNEEWKNDLLPNKRYFEARKKILLWNGIHRCYNSYAPEIGIAICFSYNKLIYVGQRTKNIGYYNHIGIEKHWATYCTRNSFCNVSYDEYLQRVEQKAIYG
ncbi:12188_t:CDS:2, partial [Gigaspora margarita]